MKTGIRIGHPLLQLVEFVPAAERRKEQVTVISRDRLRLDPGADRAVTGRKRERVGQGITQEQLPQSFFAGKMLELTAAWLALFKKKRGDQIGFFIRDAQLP